MNNKIRLITILVASFFLITLGMRNPYLSGGSAPKPHPRAVIENAAKNTLDVVQQLEIEATTPCAFLYSAPDQFISPLTPASETVFPPLIRPISLAARAPPSPSPQRS